MGCSNVGFVDVCWDLILFIIINIIIRKNIMREYTWTLNNYNQSNNNKK